MKTIKYLLSMMLIVLLSGIFVASQLQAQSVRASLFKDTDQILQEAKNADAPLLAPKNFDKGMEKYREAEKDLKKGKDLEGIRKKLKEASTYFSKAINATPLAKVTFASCLKARSDAEKAGADKLATKYWDEAENIFRESAIKLEDGDVNGAKKSASKAEKIYRQAELGAIKTACLQETWNLLQQAEKMKVKKDAPITLERARKLMNKADEELSRNRYNTDEPCSLAREANYEIKHAIYLHNLIRKMKKSKTSQEELILACEEPIQQIADSLDVKAEFDEGFEKPVMKIMGVIKSYRDSLSTLKEDVNDRNQKIASLEEKIKELNARLGTVAKQQSTMEERLQAQAKMRKQFNSVEKMFASDEAQVLRQGNDIILRLVGLNFPSGKSVIEPQYFRILTKVQKAINTFPNARVTIEGNTDSFGNAKLNLKLSQERAEAVRQYLLANMPNLKPEQIDAVGYGESRPIASNKTAEGRAKNRRIDVVIHPQF